MKCHSYYQCEANTATVVGTKVKSMTRVPCTLLAVFDNLDQAPYRDLFLQVSNWLQLKK